MEKLLIAGNENALNFADTAHAIRIAARLISEVMTLVLAEVKSNSVASQIYIIHCVLQY